MPREMESREKETRVRLGHEEVLHIGRIHVDPVAAVLSEWLPVQKFTMPQLQGHERECFSRVRSASLMASKQAFDGCLLKIASGNRAGVA